MYALEKIIEAEIDVSGNGHGDGEVPEDLDLNATDLYLTQLAKHPLLSAEEELELIIQYQDNLKYIKDVEERKIELEEKALAKAKDAYEQANEKLHRYNQRFIISIANRYTGQGLSFMDLIQEGNTGFLKALKKFDRDRGYRLCTYAGWWVMQAMTRAVLEEGGSVRFPVHAGDASYKVRKTIGVYKDEHGERPSIEYIVKATGYTPNMVKSVIRWMHPLSLDMPVGEYKDGTLGECVEDTNIESPVDYAMETGLEEEMAEALQNLTPKEKRVIELRFGLLDGNSMTLEEVGHIIGVTRERARQIQVQTLRKLRHPMHSRKLIEYLD